MADQPPRKPNLGTSLTSGSGGTNAILHGQAIAAPRAGRRDMMRANDATADPVRAEAQAFSDGRDPRLRRVDVQLADTLQIFEHGAFLTAWALADIRRVAGAGGLLAIRSVTAPPSARCEIGDPSLAAAIERRCRLLDGEAQEARGRGVQVFAMAAAAAAALAAVVWFVVPAIADRLAPLVPVAVEKRIGQAADAQARAMFKGKICSTPAGAAALARLVGRLKTAADGPLDVEAAVLSSPTPNAFALPGGRVYVLSGLLDHARSVDEVAGVLAHEFGHVAHRDSLRVALRQGGAALALGIVFGDVFGAGAILAAARASLSAAYSREAETEADDYAVVALRRAGRPAAPLGEFLMRVAADHASGPIAFLQDHPLSSDRLARIRRSSGEATGAPLLTEAEWADLRGICAGGG